MGRRWLPDELGPRHLLVNLPAYTIEVRERIDGTTQTVMDMPAVIGMANAGSWTTPAAGMPPFSGTVPVRRR